MYRSVASTVHDRAVSAMGSAQAAAGHRSHAEPLRHDALPASACPQLPASVAHDLLPAATFFISVRALQHGCPAHCLLLAALEQPALERTITDRQLRMQGGGGTLYRPHPLAAVMVLERASKVWGT